GRPVRRRRLRRPRTGGVAQVQLLPAAAAVVGRGGLVVGQGPGAELVAAGRVAQRPGPLGGRRRALRHAGGARATELGAGRLGGGGARRGVPALADYDLAAGPGGGRGRSALEARLLAGAPGRRADARRAGAGRRAPVAAAAG